MQTFSDKERRDARVTKLFNAAGNQISLAHAIDNLSQVFLKAVRFIQDPECVEPQDMEIYKPENRTSIALQKGKKLQEELTEIAEWLSFEETQIPPPTRLRVKQLLEEAYNFLNPNNAGAKRHMETVVKAFEVFQLGEIQSQKSARG